MAQFGRGILPLMVKTGHFHSEPVQERYCVLCKDWSIVNEKHFFKTSKFYETNRNSFFHCVNLDEIVNLNIMEKKKSKTAKYLNLIYSVRHNYLYKPKYINALINTVSTLYIQWFQIDIKVKGARSNLMIYNIVLHYGFWHTHMSL